MKHLIDFVCFISLAFGPVIAAEEPSVNSDGPNLAVSFAEGEWDQNDWLFARSPRWEEHSRWIQEKDGISNALPEGVDPENIPADRMAEAYASLLYKQPFHGNVCFKTECQFEQRMAPLLVFSKELTPVHHEHLEVVLYDGGINLWHHYYENDKPSWKLIGFMDMNLEPGKRYEFSARFAFTGKGTALIMECEGQTFGTMIDGNWPRDYYAGITACEGINRFYRFSAETNAPMTRTCAERFPH